MKIGLQITRFNWPGSPENIGPTLAQIAQTADEAFDSLWVMDHFFQIDPGIGRYDDPMLEAYSALNYLAAFTKNVRLGALVTGVIYRNPALLVNAVTALDVLSGGRAYFGIGAAWYERESLGLGFDFPPLKERFERLEEALQITQHLWAGRREPFVGPFHTLREPVNSPQPLSRPHPPIMIGGGGEQKTLRMVAQYADACNLFARIGKDELQRKFDILKGHCEALGRDYDAIEKTTLESVHLAPGGTTAKEVVAHIEDYAGLGVEHMIFNMPNYHEITPVETFVKEIIPAVKNF